MKSGDIFKFFQLTRSMPQTGYVTMDIQQEDLSNLAEHHYNVAMIAWYIARHLINNRIQVNMGRVLELSLLHDMGELFGGDIGMVYRKANPEALKLAKDLEASNQSFIASLFGNDSTHVKEVFESDHTLDTLESIIVKTADYIEVTHFKIYIDKFSQKDIDLVLETMLKRINTVKDQKARETLTSFIQEWIEGIPGKTIEETLNEM